MSPSVPVLVSHNLCPYVQRAIIALTEKHVVHERTYIDLADKPAWFRDISPLGKVPLLMVDDAVLFESAVICEYLEETMTNGFHPSDPLEKARHRTWIEFGSSILNDIAGLYNAQGSEAFDVKKAIIAGKFEWLERSLGEGPYFAGPQFSLVDAAFGPIFRYFDVFEEFVELGIFERTPHVSSWRTALRRRPSVANAVDDTYGARLLAFLRRRDSWISTLIPTTQEEAA